MQCARCELCGAHACHASHFCALQDPSVQAWARQRPQEAGLPRPRDVHAVSSMKPGCLPQVGAQNAGKSSLSNAMRRAVQRDAARRTSLTVAALPGKHALFAPGSWHVQLMRLPA